MDRLDKDLTIGQMQGMFLRPQNYAHDTTENASMDFITVNLWCSFKKKTKSIYQDEKKSGRI